MDKILIYGSMNIRKRKDKNKVVRHSVELKKGGKVRQMKEKRKEETTQTENKLLILKNDA